MVALVSGALLTGLISTPHCLGMCGPIAAAAGRPAGGTIAWTFGRILTYAALGALAGSLAGVLGRWNVVAGVLAALVVLAASGSLAGLWHLPALIPASLAKRAHGVRGAGLGGSLLLGVITGLLPCGVVWGGVALAASAGGGLAGAVTMASLGLGTLPAFAVVGEALRRWLGGSLTARRIAAVVVLLTGWGMIGWRVTGAMHSEDGKPACH